MLVGITAQKIKHPKYNEIGYYLDQKWFQFSKMLGIQLVILNNLKTTNLLLKNRKIKAIILSGGGQLSSSFPSIVSKIYTFKDNIDNEREAIEKKLISFAFSTKIPLIGVCRGMQAVGKYFGSKLTQIKGHVNTRHKLKYYCPIMKKKILRTVNSFHDYGFKVSETSIQLEVSVSYSNIVEQFIHKNRNILGLMWHPEREKKFSNYDLDLFKVFLRI